MSEKLSSQQFARATGLTFRQVDYYCRHGIFGEKVMDTGSGYHRRFESSAVKIGQALNRLSVCTGVDVSAAIKLSVAETVRESGLESGWVVVTEEQGVVVFRGLSEAGVVLRSHPSTLLVRFGD